MKKRKYPLTLTERLDDYIEFADSVKNFSRKAFYKELKAELITNYEGLELVDRLCYSMSDEEQKESVYDLIEWQRKQDNKPNKIKKNNP